MRENGIGDADARPFGHAGGAVDAGRGQKYCEFFSPVAANEIFQSAGVDQRLSCHAEHRISARVTVAVIDGLEVIQVRENN